MKNKLRRLSGMLILLLAMTCQHAALAQGVEVNSADPGSAIQGTLNLDVTIAGNGFDNSAAVQFLVTGTTNPGGITVKGVKVRGSKKIIVNVDVLDDAEVAEFDIEVTMSGGRGGKGTTLFKVQSKPRQNIVNCDEFAANGTCTCLFNKNEDLRIFQLQGDCETAETLVLTSARIGGGGSGNTAEDWPVLKVVNCVVNPSTGVDCLDEKLESFEGKFHGSSVITNTTDKGVGVRFFNIRFDKDVSRGCDLANDDIQTAVRFVLDENTADNLDRASLLQVWDMTIDTHDGVDNDPLCTAIELIREPGFTKPDAVGNGNKDWQVFVINTAIADGSYERIGIRYEGMQHFESINPPIVSGNVIGKQACGPESDTARAIQFGRVQLSDPSDPSSQIAGVVENNTIGMATDCETHGGVGVLVVGEPVSMQMTASVVKNGVSGAFVGVLVDDNVSDVNFSGNTLTGDGVPLTGDMGICSDALTTKTKGKPNKISGFDDSIIEGGCLAP
jgi:hypothetical protein